MSQLKTSGWCAKCARRARPGMVSAVNWPRLRAATRSGRAASSVVNVGNGRSGEPARALGHEQALAAVAAELALDRLPSVVLIEGEAGIGKTTVLREALRLAGDADRKSTRLNS